jgi:hypothetical protein
MKRTILIGVYVFGFILLLISQAVSQNSVVVIPLFGDESQTSALAEVEKTGQTTCYDENGTGIECSATGQDGEYQEGMTWPTPRFLENGDGTVTDNLTGLIWLKDAGCAIFFPGDSTGQNARNWSSAITAANSLTDGFCGLSDSSSPSDWRLPNVKELNSLIDYGRYNFALPSVHPFINVKSMYWSSTTNANSASFAWLVSALFGSVQGYGKASIFYVWPVRGGN